MRTTLLLPFVLVILLAGCAAVRDDSSVTRAEPNIPAVDVNVEVQEAPGLFQVTRSGRNTARYR